MKHIKNFIKEEKAAAQMIEAAIIYPIVFLIIFLMIYMGLYILQTITVGAYAQKIAMLASREVSSPGYYSLLSKENYSNAAIELDTKGNDINAIVDTSKMAKKMTEFPVVYRYWGGENALTEKSYYENILKTMIKDNSVIATDASSEVRVNISCENYLLVQYVNVTVEQDLMHLDLLDFFGIENPKITATAKATVSDTDELIRNTDFVVDAVDALASKLGIDTTKLKSEVDGVLKKLGLI